MTHAGRLADFAVEAPWEGVSASARQHPRTRVLGSLGCVIGGSRNAPGRAAAPTVFSWYIKNCGPEVNLFVDHSQIVQLECLRSGIWGTSSLWGRAQTYKDQS